MGAIKEIFKSPSLKTLGVFAGGNLFVAVLGGLGGVLQARWIDPEAFGEFRKFGILTTYFYIGMVLVHDGLARQFPFLIGKGVKDEALKTAAAAKCWYLLLSWFFSLVFIVLVIISLLKNNIRAAVGWGAQIACVWSSMYGAYLGVMYRTSSDFKRLSYNNVVTSVIGFCSLVIVKLFGYWGLAVRFVLINSAGVIINHHFLPVKVRAEFDFKRLMSLAQIALPLSVPGYIHTSCLSASISFIMLQYCGQSALGIYGMALTFQGMAMTFTAALNQIFVTKLTCKFGETDDVDSCIKYARVPTCLSIIAATGLAIVLCILIGPFIRCLLPKYVEAIPAIRVLSISLPISAAALPLIVLQSALWYKSIIALAMTRFLVTLSAVALMPKTLSSMVICLVFGEFCSVAGGYIILKWGRRVIQYEKK